MLRLGQHIRRRIAGRGRLVGDEQRLCGTGQLVDGHVAVYLSLGQHHKDIAGTQDLVHPGDGLGAIGQGADGLGAPDAVNLVNLGHVGSSQDGIVQRPSSGWRGHDNLGHAGHAGGDGGHEQGGGIGSRPVGRIDTHPLQGTHALTQSATVVIPGQPGTVGLLLVKSLNTLRAEAQGLAQILVGALPGGLNALRRHPQVGQLCVIEEFRIMHEGAVSLGLYPGQNARHDLLRRQGLAK